MFNKLKTLITGQSEKIRKIDHNKVKTSKTNDTISSLQSPGSLIDGVVYEHLNLTFIIDITGSMGSFINMARNKIGTMIHSIASDLQTKLSEVHGNYQNFKLHTKISVIGYRDFSDSVQFEYLPMTTDLSEVFDMLKSINVSGGGDIPEDVLGGFALFLENFKPLNTDSPEYKHTTNAIVLIADAPGHGVFMNGGCGDNHINPDDEEIWIDILNQLKKYNIDLICVQLTNCMNQMIHFLQKTYDDNKYKIAHVLVLNGNVQEVETATTHAMAGACISSVTRR